MGNRKKIQLRRCQNCQRVGHNRATCNFSVEGNDFVPEISNETNYSNSLKPHQPVHFFVHHVTSEPTQSPHVLNLKKDASIWDEVKVIQPEKNESLYHTYHQQSVVEKTDSPKITVSPILPETEITNNLSKNFDGIFSRFKPQKEAFFSVQLVNQIPETKTAKLLPVSADESWIRKAKQLFNTVFNKPRLALTASLLALTVIIPGPAYSYYHELTDTKNNLVENSSEAFIALQDSTIALKQADVNAAQKATDTAMQKFNGIIAELDDIKLLSNIAKLIPVVGGSLSSREKIVLAGQEIALGNNTLLEGIAESQDKVGKTLTDRTSSVITKIQTALPNYEKADKLLNEVDISTLPLEYQAQFKEYKLLFSSIVKDFQTINGLGTNLLEIFGGSGRRRYILVFQNPNEIRPTGGFMGSFAVLELKDGQIVKLDIPAGGTYDVQGQLKKFVEPPTPLLLANKRWEFQDANWYPDFSKSAEKILWFYRHSYGVTADGVVAINSTVLERLLTIVGPVKDQKRNVVLTNADAITTLQKIVEEGPEKKINKPKQILADLAPELLRSITSTQPENILPLLNTLQGALSQKEIQAYFSDADTQAAIESFGWAGKIKETKANQDFLMVINTNIQGEKTDAKIEQTISHQAVVSQDGTIIDNIVITRKHTGTKGEKLYGIRNIDYLRLYVPEGSQLIEASGFTWPDEKAFRAPEKWYEKDSEISTIDNNSSFDPNSGTQISTESNKTVFGNWIITEPGETTQVQFTYRLPFKVEAKKGNGNLEMILKPFKKDLAEYQLLVQRQSGVNSNFESQIIFPESWKTSWNEGDHMTLASNGAKIAPHILNSDQIWSLIMER